MLQETFDKLGKELRVESTLNDLAVEHAIKRDGRKNGIASRSQINSLQYRDPLTAFPS